MSRRNFSSASSTCLRFRRRSSASIWIEVPHLGQVSVGFSSSRAMLSSICSPHFGHGNGIFTSQFSIFKNVKGFGLVCQVNNYPKKAGKPLSFNAPPDSHLPAAPSKRNPRSPHLPKNAQRQQIRKICTTMHKSPDLTAVLGPKSAATTPVPAAAAINTSVAAWVNPKRPRPSCRADAFARGA